MMPPQSERAGSIVLQWGSRSVAARLRLSERRVLKIEIDPEGVVTVYAPHGVASGLAYYCVISETQTVAERDGFEPSVWISIPHSRHRSRAWYLTPPRPGRRSSRRRRAFGALDRLPDDLP
jgi:hypothetical protein